LTRKNHLGKKAAVSMLAASLAFPVAVQAADTAKVPVQSGSAVLSAGEAVSGEQLVPARVLAESLGASVSWDGDTRTVTLIRGTAKAEFRIGEQKAVVNGEDLTLPAAVQLMEESTYVPLEVIRKAFGSGIGWDDRQRRLTVSGPDIAPLATSFLYELENGRYAEARNRMSAPLQQAVPEELLKLIWEGSRTAYGKLLQQNPTRTERNSVHQSVTLDCLTEKLPLQITVRFDGSGQVDDLTFTPAYAVPGEYIKPAYEKADAYTEREVVVGEGTFALPATLTLPKGEGPFPAVVLVHGSGPHDRDSSYGGAKPFRDIAVGLANHGIAVLRYEKLTREHPFKTQADPKFTIGRESVDDAIRAVDLLAGLKEIDPKRIVVAGHSQGGLVLPKIIEQAQKDRIAGAIALAAPSSRFLDVLQEQQQVLLERLKKSGLPTEGAVQSAAFWDSIVKLVNDRQYSTENLPKQFPMSGAYWWYEQRDYVPAELAAAQSMPMLFVQGENDWQVPASQLEGWKRALKDRTDVTYKTYPKMNHLLTDVDVLSTGMEYSRSANVSPALIEDMAKWILQLNR
jgi:dienelactone hydrolase